MSLKIRIVVGTVLVIALAVVAVLLLTGGSGEQQASRDGSPTSTARAGHHRTGASGGASSSPSLRTFARDAATGTVVSVQADGLVRRPREIWLRVSAAPKQPVGVAWALSCGSGASALDNYTVTPPDLRQLKVPRKKKIKVCTVSVSARLSAKGRLKVALLRDR